MKMKGARLAQASLPRPFKHVRRLRVAATHVLLEVRKGSCIGARAEGQCGMR